MEKFISKFKIKYHNDPRIYMYSEMEGSKYHKTFGELGDIKFENITREEFYSALAHFIFTQSLLNN